MEAVSIRKHIIQLIFIITAIILLARLFFIQVLDNTYEAKAMQNSVREVTIYPARGLIFDRFGQLVVNNEAVYDLVVIPKEARNNNLDTLKLCHLLDITQVEFDKSVQALKKSKGYSHYKPQVLFKQIPYDVYAKLQEYLYQFPGFYPQVRTVRHYPHQSAAHILGYIGEVNQRQIDTSEYYKLGDYTGISGIEFTYEKWLRGKRGKKYMVVDVLNREIDTYDGGDIADAEAGERVTLSLDIELQNYAEQLMANKKGSVVAIEPATGEILTMVSSPTYNPNMLVGRARGIGMKMLQADTLKPLFNRALMAHYPPGSTFKPLMGLLALQEEVIYPNFYYGCNGGYHLGRLTVGCHYHASCGSVSSAVQHSCNAYFCHLFKLFIEADQFENVAVGLTKWDDYLHQFGMGTTLPLDLPHAHKGFAPDTSLYNRMYGKNRWRASTIISLGIGQGELGVTPLQMANSTAAIANHGYYYYPHVVRPPQSDTSSIYLKRQNIAIAERHFETVVDGMHKVVLAGTATIANVEGLDICGKTGTAENPHGADHSLFIAFAPKDNPKIAIAVVVENAGFGARYGAPIASLLIEKYLNREIGEKRKWLETKMLEADLLNPPKIAAK
ncbi:MAG: penicillin-binding protein 2 [Chitinophagales bacterium]